MSLVQPRRPIPPDTPVTQPDDAVIWVHEAFCSMALPMRATRGAWQRDIDAGCVRIEPIVIDDLVPSGRVLRLSMWHICNAAFRANSQVVELGHDRALLAATLGIDPKTRDLADQWQRLQFSQIMFSQTGSTNVSMFDAQGQRRSGEVGWRSGVRLSNRFLSELVDRLCVPLDRRIVRELSATPAALDAYAWIRMSLRHVAVDEIATTTWDDLLRRFGIAPHDVAEFRSAFESALRFVFDADPSIALAVGSEGVSVGHAGQADEDIEADSTMPMPPGSDVIDVDAEKQVERLAMLRSTVPAVAAEIAKAVELYNAVDLVNQLEREKQQGKAGNMARQLVQTDAVILDEGATCHFPPQAAPCCSI